MEGEAVNKKCIESLIKAGAFDNFTQTRSTLMASFEDILDTISGSSKKNIQGQVSMFDFGATNTDTTSNESDLEKLKYNYTTLKEYTDQELLSMEKEMLGIYISGHPLEKYREIIKKQANINAMQIKGAQEKTASEGENPETIINNENLQDGQFVKYAGIITSVKKKYTKNNKIMAFVTVEDLYGSVEIIIFENCYMQCSNELIEENIVLVEGRLSVREDEETKIVAREIKKLTDNKKQSLNINITNLTEEQKDRLRGALKFFTGDSNNMQVQIINEDKISPAGGLYVTKEILEELQEIVGVENASIG